MAFARWGVAVAPPATPLALATAAGPARFCEPKPLLVVSAGSGTLELRA
jgi:hypothetical protein